MNKHDLFQCDPPESPKWLKPDAPRITLENMTCATGPMMRMKPGEIAGKGDAVKEKSGGAVMPFGKYRNRLIVDVNEEDPGYVQWACEAVPGFAQKAKAVGIEIEGNDE